MNWSKIKNIMIGILLLINVFLLADIGLTKYMSSALPRGTGENFVSLLEKNSITIEKELVPRYYETRVNMTTEFYTLDQLSAMFLGSKIGFESHGDGVVAKNQSGQLFVRENKIEFATNKERAPKNADDIIKAMNAINISTEGAVFDAEEGVVKVVVDLIEVEGIYLDIELDKDGKIAYAEGIWPKITVDGTDDEVSVISAIVDICEALPDGAHITDIEKIYLFESIDKVPAVKNAWRIYADGRSYAVS